MSRKFELSDEHVAYVPRTTKKRRPHTRTIDEELERTINKVSALSIDGPGSSSNSDNSSDDEAHLLDLPDSMITPRLVSSSSALSYPGLGDLSMELHHRICSHLNNNDIWNLSGCNRSMSVSFPASISTFRTRGAEPKDIANQLSALHRTPFLKHLTIEGFRSSSAAWASDLVRCCPRLTRLRLINCTVNVPSYAALGFLAALSCLEVENAQVDDFHRLFSPQYLSVLSSPACSPSSASSQASSISTLSTESGGDHNPIPNLFPALERLSVMPMRSYELAIIVAHMPGLKKLKATLEAEEKPSRHLAQACQSLHSLTLNTTYCDKPMPIKFIKSFRILSTLKTLDLSTGVDDNNIASLCSNLRGLTTLRIKSAHNLGEVGLDAIRTLPQLRCLFIDFGLRISRNQSEETLWKWLLPFKNMSSLSSLALLLPDTYLLRVIHDHLLKHLPNISYLRIGSCVYGPV